VDIDNRDLRGGEKTWQHIKKGVPIRLEVGPRDMASDSVFMGRRDLGPKEKSGVSRAEFVSTVTQTLEDIQSRLFDRALSARQEATASIGSVDDFRSYFDKKGPGGFAVCHAADDPSYEPLLKDLKVTARCIPIAHNDDLADCIFTGQSGQRKILFSRAY